MRGPTRESLMFMTMEKIDPPAPIPETEPEHPAVRAAREIKAIHLDTIANINAGTYRPTSTNDAGETVDATEDVRAACMKQIGLCDGIITVTRGMLKQGMPATMFAPLEQQLKDIRSSLDGEVIPEIGNYEHKTD